MIFDKLFHLMAEKKASDIFITAGAPIQIKIQGSIVPVNQQVLDPEAVKQIAYEILTPEQIKMFEEDMEINLSHPLENIGNFRINMFYQRGSVAVVVRFISGTIPRISDLGIPAVLAELVMEKLGLILVVGATGSGKSTTMAAMLDHRNENSSGHILTVEDPIEFLFRHKKSIINQREVGSDTHRWANALKNAMRQAPDCILIGEIRDRETMEIALAYAQTGHLCLATLHANNSYHALNRIISFFPMENRSALYLDLASTMKAIISQRLVRTRSGERVAVVEILRNTRYTQDLIEKGDINGVKEAMEKSLTSGSQTFEQDLVRMVRDGMITVQEAVVHADSPTNLTWQLNNAEAATKAQSEAVRREQGLQEGAVDENTGASFSEFSFDIENQA